MNLTKKQKGIIISLVLVAVDLISKHIIIQSIAFQEQVTVIKNFFWLTHVRNTGAAWSLFSNNTLMLTLISAIAFSALLYFYIKQTHSKWTTVSLILMLAGTFGNLVDRFLFGYVRDFLSFNLFGYMFPVFNLADSFLVIGVGVLFVETILQEKNNA